MDAIQVVDPKEKSIWMLMALIASVISEARRGKNFHEVWRVDARSTVPKPIKKYAEIGDMGMKFLFHDAITKWPEVHPISDKKAVQIMMRLSTRVVLSDECVGHDIIFL